VDDHDERLASSTQARFLDRTNWVVCIAADDERLVGFSTHTNRMPGGNV
jgi:hypothetical protein